MGALDQITQLRSQGLSDEDIMQNLQKSGFPLNEINDAFGQAQIKQAVAADAPGPNSGTQQQVDQQNIIPGQQIVPQQNEVYAPQGQQGFQEQEEIYYPQPQDNSQGYQDQGDYYSPGGVDTSTIIEIAEQVFLEKTQNLQKQIEDAVEFKALASSKMENLDTRIKKIEKMIDGLQISILQKVGSYGGNLESVKKEMSMMQDSFRKMVNPIVRRSGEKITQKKEVKKPPKLIHSQALKKQIKTQPIMQIKKSSKPKTKSVKIIKKK